MIRPFVRALEAALVDTAPLSASMPARATATPDAGVDPESAPRKIGALGLRVERGVTYHGIALNVTADLADFDLIDPCGMPGVARPRSPPSGAERGPAADGRLRRPTRLASSPRAFAAPLGGPPDGPPS